MSAVSSGKVEVGAVPGAADAAWASLELPLTAQQLLEFLADIERLFRLNPHLEITAWQASGPPAGSYRMSALNESNGRRSEVSIRTRPLSEDAGLVLEYDSGLKRSTELRIAPAAAGSLLTVTECYQPVSDDSDERLKEVDRSLVPWVASIRRHLTRRARYGEIPGYQWWAERFMLGMPPRQRRMVRMIVWVSVLEFCVFAFVVAIYWLEAQRS